jgi:hypothetical protein
MKKITIILALILIIINFNGCSTFISYFINKNDCKEFIYMNPNNSLDTLSKIYAISKNPPPRLDSISVIYVIVIPKENTNTIFNKSEMKLKFNGNYINLNYDKYFIRSLGNEYYKYNIYSDKIKELRFSFEPGLKEGDTLTLFTNGILTYENGTKILQDSINIIVPD